MNAGLNGFRQHQFRSLLEALQVQQQHAQETVHGVLGSDLKAEITQGLSCCK